MENLINEAKKLFESYPTEQVLFATEDGMFFLESNRHDGLSHAATKQLQLHTFKRDELEAPLVAVGYEEELAKIAEANVDSSGAEEGSVDSSGAEEEAEAAAKADAEAKAEAAPEEPAAEAAPEEPAAKPKTVKTPKSK